jgi:exopolysaccharide biosynthesis WecB/TagA/CpsF family protein
MKILNTRCDDLTVSEAIDKTLALVKSPLKSNMFYLNIDCLRKADRDPEYRAIMNEASLVLPDGIGLRLIARLCGRRFKFNCRGITDFFTVLMQRAAEEGYKIFLLGGLPGVAEKAAQRLKILSPSIQIVGTYEGYFDSDQTVLDRINFSGADVLVVAMGAPLQEKWIDRNRQRLDARLCLGVGALFDFWSRRVRRAPKILRVLNLEWLWRLCLEPDRLAQRYWNDFQFLAIVLKKRLSGEL